MGNIERWTITPAAEVDLGDGDYTYTLVRVEPSPERNGESFEVVRADALQGAVEALERIRDWDLDPMDDAEYVWDELRKIAVEVVGPRPSTNRGQ